MTTIYCGSTDCVHNGQFVCKREVITLAEEYDMMCSEYESYLDSKEYQNEYFIRVRTCDKKEGKGKKHGKKIEYNGFVFYTDCAEWLGEVKVTEERTGLMCGDFEKLKTSERWEKFLKAMRVASDCAELPLVEYNPKSNKWEYVEKDNEQREAD